MVESIFGDDAKHTDVNPPGVSGGFLLWRSG